MLHKSCLLSLSETYIGLCQSKDVHFTKIWISILKIRWSWDHLIFKMEIHIFTMRITMPRKLVFIFKKGSKLHIYDIISYWLRPWSHDQRQYIENRSCKLGRWHGAGRLRLPTTTANCGMCGQKWIMFICWCIICYYYAMLISHSSAVIFMYFARYMTTQISHHLIIQYDMSKIRWLWWVIFTCKIKGCWYIDGLVQERCNSSAWVTELRLSYINPSI